ncbi:MAG: excinuclease ABC subunit A, partial [Terracidiphilus sp.]
MNDAIIIRNARTHNLKNLSCEIPHGKLTVISGVSGSGKSSLAFDTIYAEGQRRYVESLSAYARQFLERIEKPDADEIDGLAPAIAIKQKNTTRNPRSTVATATEIYDYLRLLYARCGTVHCIHCDGLVKRDSVDEAAAVVLALGEGTRLNVLFPVMASTPAEAEASMSPAKAGGRAAKPAGKAKASAKASESPYTESLRARLTDLRSSGFNRLWQQGKIVEFSTPESLLELDFTLPVFVLLDRIVVNAEARPRIVDAIESAYREANEVIFEEAPRDEPA